MEKENQKELEYDSSELTTEENSEKSNKNKSEDKFVKDNNINNKNDSQILSNNSFIFAEELDSEDENTKLIARYEVIIPIYLCNALILICSVIKNYIYINFTSKGISISQYDDTKSTAIRLNMWRDGIYVYLSKEEKITVGISSSALLAKIKQNIGKNNLHNLIISLIEDVSIKDSKSDRKKKNKYKLNISVQKSISVRESHNIPTIISKNNLEFFQNDTLLNKISPDYIEKTNDLISSISTIFDNKKTPIEIGIADTFIYFNKSEKEIRDDELPNVIVGYNFDIKSVIKKIKTIVPILECLSLFKKISPSDSGLFKIYNVLDSNSTQLVFQMNIGNGESILKLFLFDIKNISSTLHSWKNKKNKKTDLDELENDDLLQLINIGDIKESRSNKNKKNKQKRKRKSNNKENTSSSEKYDDDSESLVSSSISSSFSSEKSNKKPKLNLKKKRKEKMKKKDKKENNTTETSESKQKTSPKKNKKIGSIFLDDE